MSTVMCFDDDHSKVIEKMVELYQELFSHDGYGNMSIEMKFLKKGQKEVLIRCGKDYRFVIDYMADSDGGLIAWKMPVNEQGS